MPYLPEHRADIEAMPAALRAVLEAELAAGNEIVDVSHSHPAPPVGAAFKLARPVSTRPRDADDGLVFRAHDSSLYSGQLTDAKAFFHILDPPLPPSPQPTMDEIRNAHSAGWDPAPPARRPEPAAPVVSAPAAPVSPLRRFEQSMVMDYEKWHDGIGYDLDALAEMTAKERATVEKILAEKRPRDWRDVEALAELGTKVALAALKAALADPDARVRMAVTRHAPELVPEAKRTASLARALRSAELYGGLSQAIDEAAEFHPPKVVEELFRGALKRDSEAAVHFAALLFYIHGKADVPFDDAQRPFFLRFATEDRKERREAFRELCERVGADPAKYLKS